jgi:acyl-coenzyme A thioesterase PaaI-like protein
MILDFSNLKKVVIKDNQIGCFGASETSPLNKKLDLYTDGESLFTQFKPNSNHMGWGGVVHGGVFSVILEELLGLEAVLKTKQACIAKNITVNFQGPTSFNDVYTLVAKLETSIGNHQIDVIGEVFNSGSILCLSACGRYHSLNIKPKKIIIFEEGD